MSGCKCDPDQRWVPPLDLLSSCDHYCPSVEGDFCDWCEHKRECHPLDQRTLRAVRDALMAKRFQVFEDRAYLLGKDIVELFAGGKFEVKDE